MLVLLVLLLLPPLLLVVPLLLGPPLLPPLPCMRRDVVIILYSCVTSPALARTRMSTRTSHRQSFTTQHTN